MFENGLLGLAFLMIGGLGIFIYGMHLTSDGLSKLAGARMKWVLTKLTTNRVIGATVGAIMTAAVQSSSFMSVMVVGLVSAHLLTLMQAASLIIGMNIGTTFTVQIIAFELSALALPIIGLGVYLNLFTKKESLHFGGQSLIGVGMLFLGLMFMKDAFEPLKDNPAFFEFFVNYGSNIILATLFGVIATMVIQSSAAIIGITIALASSGMLALPASIAIVLGSNIGTTLTAQIAAFSMNRTAKRAAMLHTIFNVVGVVWVMIVFGWFIRLVEWGTPDDASMARHIANAHTFFNVVNVVVFLIFLPYLVKLVEWILPPRQVKKIRGMYVLHKGFLKTPEIALLQVKFACIAMFDTFFDNLKLCEKYISDSKNEAHFFKTEEKINTYREEVSKYLGKIGANDLTEKQAQSIPILLHLVNDIESMADCVKRIVKNVQEDGVSPAEGRVVKKLLSDLEGYLERLHDLLERPNRDRMIALEEDLIDFRKKKLDKIKGYRENLECIHDIVRKMANVLVMTREV